MSLRIVWVQISACLLILAVNLYLSFVQPGWCAEQDLGQEFIPHSNDKLEKLQIYFETGMYEEAANLLRELSAQFPNEPRFKYLEAIVSYQRGDYQQASKVFTEFIQAYPEIPEPYYLLAEASLKNGSKEQAKEYLAKYCALVPQDINARFKLNSISGQNPGGVAIIKDGQEDLNLVRRIGFYGACLHTQEADAIKLINGNFRTWASMGIDFAYPVDLRGKKVTLQLKGKKGGEKFMLTLRDQFAKDYTPQLELVPEGKLINDWQNLNVSVRDAPAKIDLSSVVHLGLEFGTSTVQNPAQSSLFVKDIIIDADRN